MSERLERLRRGMANVGLDGFLVGAPAEDTFHTHAANRRYLSGFTGSMGWLLITADSAFIAVDFRYFEQAEREAPDFTIFRTSGGCCDCGAPHNCSTRLRRPWSAWWVRLLVTPARIHHAMAVQA